MAFRFLARGAKLSFLKLAFDVISGIFTSRATTPEASLFCYGSDHNSHRFFHRRGGFIYCMARLYCAQAVLVLWLMWL